MPRIAIIITLKEVPHLEANQKVNVTATLSLEKDKPKRIQLKTTQKMNLVKEDCIVEDSSGSAILHIWDPMIDQLSDGSTYEFQNLTVKEFQGTTHIATSTSTSFTKVDQEGETLSGPALLENSEVQLQVKEFKSVNKLSIFTSCQWCKRKITEILQKYIKCQNCGVRQRVENCKRDASVQLLVNLPGDEEIWLSLM